MATTYRWISPDIGVGSSTGPKVRHWSWHTHIAASIRWMVWQDRHTWGKTLLRWWLLTLCPGCRVALGTRRRRETRGIAWWTGRHGVWSLVGWDGFGRGLKKYRRLVMLGGLRRKLKQYKPPLTAIALYVIPYTHYTLYVGCVEHGNSNIEIF